MARRRQARRRPPILAEVAPRYESDQRLAPWIGELDPDPRRAVSRYAWAWSDETVALRLHRETLRDDRCHDALEQRLDGLISAPLEVTAGGDRAVDRAAADDLRQQLHPDRTAGAVRKLLYALWYGYSVGEAMWAQDGRRVILDEIRVRSVERFGWGADGGLRLRSQMSYRGEPVPPQKFLVCVRDAEHDDVPHGLGLAWWCYHLVVVKRLTLRHWAIANERYGAPTIVGKYRRGAAPDEVDKLLKIVQGLSASSGAAIPEDQAVDLLGTMARTAASHEALYAACNSALTHLILRQTSTSDQGPWRGTAEVQLAVRQEAIAADARMIQAALGRIAEWLTGWNFPGAAIPLVRYDVETHESLDARAAREEIVARTTGLRPTEQHVRDVYGGDWERAPAPIPAVPAIPASLAAPVGADAEIDAATDDAASEWEVLLGPAIQPVLAAAAASRDYRAFRDRLVRVFPEMDTAALERRLINSGFSAAASGQAGLSDEESEA